MAETLFDELKRYVGFGPDDERALRALHPVLSPHFRDIAATFYRRILEHEQARIALEGGEQQVGRLKITLVAWMEKLLTGPWDEDYYELRCRIGRLHVRIALPQHYMFGAMNVVRLEFNRLIDENFHEDLATLEQVRKAVAKILDLELAIMLHTYREDLIAQAARHERLSTFGQLAGSIGHELRNPLGVIETSLYILRGRIGEDERAKKHVERIGEQLGIANGIVSALLDIIRDRPLLREKVQLAPLVEQAIGQVQRPEGVALEVEGFDSVPALDGDQAQLRQVLVNLVENAVHATSPAGKVRVQGRVLQNGHVEIVVADTGPGVDDATRRRLFEPLITTKVKGIGLGLALVKRIVERHGGTIAYQPEEGWGARFVVRLPAAG